MAIHTIDIQPIAARVLVLAGARVVADTCNALILTESATAPALYLPARDIDLGRLLRTAHSTFCLHKGLCSHFSVLFEDGYCHNVAWSYEAPYTAAAALARHYTFQRGSLDIVVAFPERC